MYCEKCGNQINDDAKFCTECGESTGTSAPPQTKLSNAEINQLYEETYSHGYSVALQLTKNTQDAQDILQEAYITAFDKYWQLADKSKFTGWFNRIVSNKCYDFLRKKNPMLFSSLNTDEDAMGFQDSLIDEKMDFRPEEHADYTEIKRLMQGILSGLPDDQRMCVLMYYYDEMSIGEIAETLQISPGTVKSRLNYARQKIKTDVESLEKKGTKLYGIAPIPFIIWMLRGTNYVHAASFATVGVTTGAGTASAVGTTATGATTASTSGATAATTNGVSTTNAGSVATTTTSTGSVATTTTSTGSVVASTGGKMLALKVVVGILTVAALGTTSLVVAKQIQSKRESPAQVVEVTPSLTPSVTPTATPRPTATPTPEVEVAPEVEAPPEEAPPEETFSWTLGETIQILYGQPLDVPMNIPLYLGDTLEGGAMVFRLYPDVQADGFNVLFPVGSDELGWSQGSDPEPEEMIKLPPYRTFKKSDIPSYNGPIESIGLNQSWTWPGSSMYDGDAASIIFMPPAADGSLSFKFWKDEDIDNLDFDKTYPLKMLNENVAFFDVPEIGIGVIDFSNAKDDVTFTIVSEKDTQFSGTYQWVSGD